MSSFDEQQFSRDLKIQKLNFLEGEVVNHSLLEHHLDLMKTVSLDALKTDIQKNAFWINVYNGLTNVLIIQRKIRKSMMANPTVFMLPKFQIDRFRFSLDDIEHGILRKNRRASYKPWGQFLPWDKRRKLMVEKVDFRIHFALNCGAKSCPPIVFYSAPHLEEELIQAEEGFKQQYWHVDEVKKRIRCSLIYKANKVDFEDKYLNDKRYSNFKVEVMKYDWSL